MKDHWTHEKSATVEPRFAQAFGIMVHSRYGKACELVELMEIARIIASEELEELVDRIVLDSKSQTCGITLLVDDRAAVQKMLLAFLADEDRFGERLDFFHFLDQSGREIEEWDK